MDFKNFRGLLSTLVFVVFFLQTCISIGSDCDFNLKVQVGQPIRLSNYAGKAHGLTTSCRWRIFSDTRVKLSCDKSILPQKLSGCRFNFYVFPNGRMVSNPSRYCDEKKSFESERNVMIVTLEGPTDIPENSFNCQFEATKDCRCGWKNPSKIYGGEPTNVHEYPMMAGIIFKPELAQQRLTVFQPSINLRIDPTENFLCGSTIISSQYLLTAAHCVLKKKSEYLGVLIGAYNIDSDSLESEELCYKVDKTVIPGYYDETNKHYDIAVIKLIDSIEYTNFIGPACLPFNRHYDFEGHNVELLGWGLDSFGGSMTGVLNKVTVTVTNFEECKAANTRLPMVDSQICAYATGKDACQMDSGGPMLWKDSNVNGLFLIGIISYGESCGSKKPSYNTRVSSFIDWIKFSTPGVTYCEVR